MVQIPVHVLDIGLAGLKDLARDRLPGVGIPGLQCSDGGVPVILGEQLREGVGDLGPDAVFLEPSVRLPQERMDLGVSLGVEPEAAVRRRAVEDDALGVDVSLSAWPQGV